MKKIPDLRSYAGTEEWIAKPFTVVDLKGSVWNVATDRAWLVAVRGRGHYPRWSGDMAQLNVILGLIQAVQVEPRIVGTEVLKSWALGGGVGKIMGVTVDREKLAKVVSLVPTSFPYIRIWNASSVMRQDPCLAIHTSLGMKMYLMGRASGEGPVFDVMKLTREPQPEKPEPTPEGWDAFDLAMSLDDGSQ